MQLSGQDVSIRKENERVGENKDIWWHYTSSKILRPATSHSEKKNFKIVVLVYRWLCGPGFKNISDTLVPYARTHLWSGAGPRVVPWVKIKHSKLHSVIIEHRPRITSQSILDKPRLHFKVKTELSHFTPLTEVAE